MERKIRKWKRFREGTLDEDNRAMADSKVKEWESKLQEHLNNNKQLRRDRIREEADLRSIQEINHKVDLKEYESYKSVLGNEAPKTLEEFQNLKYNDSKEWNLVKDYVKSRSNNMISIFTPYSQYKEYKNIIDTDIVGLTTSNGIKIKEQSKHFIERVFGTSKDPDTGRPRDGVAINDIKDAILNGVVRTRKTDPNSIKLVTDRCMVSINPNTGVLIQTNP